MRIQRNYSRPFFSHRRQTNARSVFFLGLLVGGILVLVSLRFSQLQLTALDMIGMAPTSTPFASELATRGMERYLAGDVKGAVALFEQAVRQQPNNVDYLYEYGKLLIEDDRDEEAIPLADRAMEIAPDDPRGYALKGRALMWDDDPTQAILVSIQGTDADPNYAPLLAVQGVAYTRLGRWQEGIRQARRAVELDPSDPFVQRSLYYPLVYVGLYQDAIDALTRAIALNPNLVNPYFELANIYTFQQVNEPEMAIAIYNKITEMQPNNPKAYLRLCETYARVDEARFDVAQPYCDQAIRIDPEYAPAYRQRGQMQYNRRNYEGAIDSFERCVELESDWDPRDKEIECWYLRGLAHWLLGECETAWNVLLEARDLGKAQGRPEGEGPMDSIDIGLFNITATCPGYSTVTLPTSPPPTAIPPTPIGGFG